MANEDIRELIKKKNIKYWEVAYRYGIADCNFSKKLRFELSRTDKEKVVNIIEELVKEKSN